MIIIIRDDVQAGLGSIKSDKVIIGGELVNVLTREIYKADVAIRGPKITFVGDVSGYVDEKTQVIDAKGKYLVPGLIDGHTHPESSLLSPTRFAETVVPTGTTSIMTAFDEYATVLGLPAIRYFLDEVKRTPLKVFEIVPCRVPYFPWADTTGGYMGAKEVAEALAWPESIGIWETIRTLVIRSDKDVLGAIKETRKRRQYVHGAGFGTPTQLLAGYLGAGIRSDHEIMTKEEALEKLRMGLKVQVWEGAVLSMLADIIKFATENKNIDTRGISIITDDVDVEYFHTYGHTNHLVKRAMEEGIDPVTAIQMVSLNSAETYGVDHLVGSVAPGKFADVLLVDDLKSFKVESVIANGKLAAKDGKMLSELKVPERPKRYLCTVHLKKRVTPEMMKIKTKNPRARRAKVLSMLVPPYAPIRLRHEATLEVEGGVVKPSTDQDVLYIDVVERYGKTSNIGKAFVTGFGLKEGAIATSMAHDNHNIAVLGANPEDMSYAVNHIAEIQGGQVVVSNGKVIDELRLPLCGIGTDKPAHELLERVKSLNTTAQKLGSKLKRPFMFLIFVPLAVIPDYAVTDKGFYDVKTEKFISPILEEMP